MTDDPAHILATTLATHAGTDYHDLPPAARVALHTWCRQYLHWRGTTPRAAMPKPAAPPTPDYIEARRAMRRASNIQEHQ